MKHLISINDLSKEDINELLKKTREIKKNPSAYAEALKGKLVATLFFEPSTRTRLSFTSAALRVGAKTLGFADAKTSSGKKGESLEDTIKIVNGYADIIVMRHPETGAAKRAVAVSQIPIINGGDGIGEHPTQALLDFFTIADKGKKLEDITIAFVGDLKYGRTVHSLSQGLQKFGSKMIFISPPSLKLPDEIKNNLGKIKEAESWGECADTIDVLYMTRVQQERFDNQEEYERLKDSYILNTKSAKLFKKDCLFMHPLPRIIEISPEMDNDPRSIYFEEARNGVWLRMALLIELAS